LTRNQYLKSDIMVLDFIATNNFKYPVYFSLTSGPNEYLNLGSYLQQEGMTLRLVPYKNPSGAEDGQDTRMYTDVMYNNVMKKFKYGGIEKGDHLIDYVTSRQCNNMRGVFARLARNLAKEGRNKEAIEVVDKCLEVVPNRLIVPDFYSVQLADAYYRAGAIDKGTKLSNEISKILIEELDYYMNVPVAKYYTDIPYDIQRGMYGMNNLIRLAEMNNQKPILDILKPKMEKYQVKFAALTEQLN